MPMNVQRLTILHVDMDAFYASVEQRDRPELRGKPVIVGGTEGRGVVCAASYEVRPFGVHSAMPMSTARRLCPQAVVMPVRMKYYADISRQIRDVFLSFTPLVEPLSLDEAFLDVRGSEGLFGPAPTIARAIKERIRQTTGLIASVGVAPNKFLAKLASDHGKPDGCVVLPADEVAAFLAPLPIGRLWGVGAKGEKRLHSLGVYTIGQLAALPQTAIADRLGDAGQHLWELAHGQDDRPVVPDREAKSISTETTFRHDIGDRESLRHLLAGAGGSPRRPPPPRERASACRRIEAALLGISHLVPFATLAEATDRTDLLWQAAADLFERSLTEEMLPLRLLGVGAARLSREPSTQGELFTDASDVRRQALDRTVDAIREQTGAGGHPARQRGEALGTQVKQNSASGVA